MAKKQKGRLLDYLLAQGTIDPLTAWKRLGIYRLSARILDLRKEGWNIIMERKEVINKFGEKCHVGFYSLKKGELINPDFFLNVNQPK